MDQGTEAPSPNIAQDGINPKFVEILREVRDLHDQKSMDYGTSEDPLVSLRTSTGWGIPAWVGCMIRMEDKISRLKAYVRTGKLSNEGARDSFIDIIVYAVAAVQLFDEGGVKEQE